MDAVRKRHQIAFLAQFVSETASRAASGQKPLGSLSGGEKVTDSWAGLDTDRIAVEDTALRRLSYLLGIHETPDATWTKETWERWRNTTLQTLHAYLARPLDQ